MNINNETKKYIAVMSDIHGNYVALAQCIYYALNKGAKQFVFLGDYVGELAYPQKTMEILYALQKEYTCYFIKGNKEDYWLDYEMRGENGWNQYDSTTGALYYTYQQLTAKDREFFRTLSGSDKISIDNMPDIRICHGSPRKVNEKMLNNNESTYEIMDNSEEMLILCGHTHIQDKIEHNGKMVLNAGSVGVGLHSDGKAQFLLLEAKDKSWNYEFISIDYDVERVIKELDASGLTEYAPSWTEVTKHMLKTGEISHGDVLGRAMSLCEQELGVCIWPEVPEKYWKLAVKQMI